MRRSLEGERTGLAERALVAILVLAIAAGIFLRFHGLADRSLGHPENNVPGLALPGWAIQPTPRHDVVSVLRAVVRDGHPPAWFVGMLAWNKAFGTGLATIRLPSAILGFLSLLLLHRIALRLVDRRTALIAVALLALAGHHVFWNQVARMYSAAAFLGLLSTWLLLRLVERPGTSRGWLYLLVTVLGLWTHHFIWPLVCAQGLWAAGRSGPHGEPSPVLRWQLRAVILGAPVIALAFYQHPATRWHESAAEYFDLGYAFFHKARFHGTAPEPLVPKLAVRVATLVLLALGCLAARRGGARGPAAGEDRRGPGTSLTWALGLVATGSIAAFALVVPPRGHAYHWSLLPFVAIPLALAAGARPLEGIATRAGGGLARILPGLHILLALLPFALVFAVSQARGILVARGTIVFLPYLLLAVAAGLGPLWRVGSAGPVALAALLAVQISSLRYHGAAEVSRWDHAGLAAAMAAEVRADDLVLVRNDWIYAPLWYHTTVEPERFRWREWSAAVAVEPTKRVWVVEYDDGSESPLARHVEGYRRVKTVEAHAARAHLFEPPPVTQ